MGVANRGGPRMRVPVEQVEETPGEKQACCQCPRCGNWSLADRCPQCGAHKGSLEAVQAKFEAHSQRERLSAENASTMTVGTIGTRPCGKVGSQNCYM